MTCIYKMSTFAVLLTLLLMFAGMQQCYCCMKPLPDHQREIWHHYKPTLMNNETAMSHLYDCIYHNDDCESFELQVKEVFVRYYLENCESCCNTCPDMVEDIVQYFKENNFNVFDQEDMKSLLMTQMQFDDEKSIKTFNV